MTYILSWYLAIPRPGPGPGGGGAAGGAAAATRRSLHARSGLHHHDGAELLSGLDVAWSQRHSSTCSCLHAMKCSLTWDDGWHAMSSNTNRCERRHLITGTGSLRLPGSKRLMTWLRVLAQKSSRPEQVDRGCLPALRLLHLSVAWDLEQRSLLLTYTSCLI